MFQLVPRKFVTMPLEPKRYTSPMPWAIEGMSMGSGRTIAQTLRKGTLVRVSVRAAASASATESTVPSRAEATELPRAVPRAGVEKTPRAPGEARWSSSATTGTMTATAKKTASRMRSALMPERRAAGLLEFAMCTAYCTNCMNFLREPIFLERLSTTKVRM